MIHRLKVRIKGKVQGVYYRKSTKEKADQIGIKGFVKNLEDGSVYAEIEGNKQDLMTMLQWCNQGPDRAEVISVESEEMELVGDEDFIIQRK